MEVKINREIREYTEAMFFGLSMRQKVDIQKSEQEVYVLRVLHMLVNAKPLLLNLEF